MQGRHFWRCVWLWRWWCVVDLAHDGFCELATELSASVVSYIKICIVSWYFRGFFRFIILLFKLYLGSRRPLSLGFLAINLCLFSKNRSIFWILEIVIQVVVIAEAWLVTCFENFSLWIHYCSRSLRNQIELRCFWLRKVLNSVIYMPFIRLLCNWVKYKLAKLLDLWVLAHVLRILLELMF